MYKTDGYTRQQHNAAAWIVLWNSVKTIYLRVSREGRMPARCSITEIFIQGRKHIYDWPTVFTDIRKLGRPFSSMPLRQKPDERLAFVGPTAVHKCRMLAD